MPESVDTYLISAKYYDGAYAAMHDLVDVPFYVDLARLYGGPVLEVGCGTGRVLLCIARLGIEIHGVDSSAPMLDILNRNLFQEAPAVRDRVRLYPGDMREFRLPGRFPLIIIPFRPMQHMYTVPDQLRALTTAASHLADGGILAFDVFYPKFERLAVDLGEEQLETSWSLPSDPETVVRRFYRKDELDKINQSLALTFIFRTFYRNQLVREENETLKMSYYTYPHLRALFLLAGLEPVAEYGAFDKSPLDNNSQEMIFLLRKTKGHFGSDGVLGCS